MLSAPLPLCNDKGTLHRGLPCHGIPCSQPDVKTPQHCNTILYCSHCLLLRLSLSFNPNSQTKFHFSLCTTTTNTATHVADITELHSKTMAGVIVAGIWCRPVLPRYAWGSVCATAAAACRAWLWGPFCWRLCQLCPTACCRLVTELHFIHTDCRPRLVSSTVIWLATSTYPCSLHSYQQVCIVSALTGCAWAAGVPDSSVVPLGYCHGRGSQPRRDQPYSRGPGPRDPYTTEPHSRSAPSHRGGYQPPADRYGPPPGYGPPYGAPSRDAYIPPSTDPYSRDPYAPPSRDPYAPPARAPYQPPAHQPSYGTRPSYAPSPWQAQQLGPASSRRPEQSNNPYAALQRDPRQR